MLRVTITFVFALFVSASAWAGNWNVNSANTSGLGKLVQSPSHNMKSYNISLAKKTDGQPVRSGKSSIRFELRAGDCGYYPGGHSDCRTDRERIEYAQKPTHNSWYHWSLYLPEDAPDLQASVVTLGQFHQRGIQMSQAFMFKYDGVVYRLQNDMWGFSGSSSTGTSIISTDKEMRGKWTDILINASWSFEENGFFNIYVNGRTKPLYKFKGTTINSKAGAYLKFGIYRQHVSSWSSRGGFPTQIIYYDDVNAGDSCEEVTTYFDCNAITKNIQNPDTATLNKSQKTAKYDRTLAGMTVRFKCLADYAAANDITDLPANQEIESLTTNLEGNDYYRSHRQIVKAGISKEAMDANKRALVRLVNYEGTNEEYCAKPVL